MIEAAGDSNDEKGERLDLAVSPWRETICVALYWTYSIACAQKYPLCVIWNEDRATGIYLWGAEVRRPEWIEIGEGSVIGNGAVLDGRRGIRIGKNVNFSSGVWIWTVQHNYKDPMFGDVGGAVEIGDHAWLSCRVTVLPGVSIGEGAVIAAGSVVTKNVDPYWVVGGVPAIKIGERPREIHYSLGDNRPIPFI